jgi:hypothetical protein
MDGRAETTMISTTRDLVARITLIGCLTSGFAGGCSCSGTAGDEGTVNLIAAREAGLKNPAMAKKATFTGPIGVAPKTRRPAHGR